MRAAAHSKTLRYDRQDGRYEALFEEAYADAVIDFYEGIDQYDPSLSAVRSSIVRFTRINIFTAYRAEQRLLQRNITAARLEGLSENPEAAFIQKDLYSKALQILSKLGDSCKTMLLMWFDKFSYEDIAKALQRPSADAAKQATYACRDKLNKLVSERPDFLQSF